VNNGRLHVNTIPTRVGKRVSVPHTSYVNLKNSVNKYLKQMDKDIDLLTKFLGRKTYWVYPLRT
jgi:hypothetical protein